MSVEDCDKTVPVFKKRSVFGIGIKIDVRYYGFTLAR